MHHAEINQERQRLREIAANYETALFDYNPEMGTYFRKEVALDKFKDHSLTALIAWQKEEDEFLALLNQLNPEKLKNFTEYQTYHLLKQTLVDNQAIRINQEALWNINPQPINLYDFWHSSLCFLAERQPVGNPTNRQLAITRWKSFSKVVADEIDNLNHGLKADLTAPSIIVMKVIDQLNDVLNSPIKDSPYFDFANRDEDPNFKREVKKLIETDINPAIRKYIQYLQDDYLSHARDSIGINNLLANASIARYNTKVKKESTLDISPDEIYHFGLTHMEELLKEISALGKKIFNESDPHKIFELAKRDARFRFHHEQEILEYNQQALQRAIKALPTWFEKIPKSSCIIQPYSLHLAKTGAIGEYHPPGPDGSSGIFYINTYQPEKQNRIDSEATVFHELMPGHHYQIGLLMEDTSQLPVNKYLGSPGYGEGWALYVERLADEMKLYSDDISRLGMLANESLRTARLVIDPGIHVLNWCREKAVAYLKAHSTLEEDTVQAEIDRYIMSPGQAPSYMLGKREIDHLRKLSEEKLQDKFDIKEFHDQVLKHGLIPLGLLKENIEQWIAKKR